jgi:hypothetical protein
MNGGVEDGTHLAGDPPAVEGGGRRRLGAVESRVGVHVDGVAPVVAVEELVPQRRHGQVPPCQEQERHLGCRAGRHRPRRGRCKSHQLLIVVVAADSISAPGRGTASRRRWRRGISESANARRRARRRRLRRRPRPLFRLWRARRRWRLLLPVLDGVRGVGGCRQEEPGERFSVGVERRRVGVVGGGGGAHEDGGGGHDAEREAEGGAEQELGPDGESRRGGHAADAGQHHGQHMLRLRLRLLLLKILGGHGREDRALKGQVGRTRHPVGAATGVRSTAAVAGSIYLHAADDART